MQTAPAGFPHFGVDLFTEQLHAVSILVAGKTSRAPADNVAGTMVSISLMVWLGSGQTKATWNLCAIVVANTACSLSVDERELLAIALANCRSESA